MAKPLQNITITAPAFRGLNTQDSPVGSDASFAAVADNVVIDSYGRIGARKGINLLTTDATALGSSFIETVHEFENYAGALTVFSVGNGKIFKDIEPLVDKTPVSYTITNNDFKFVNFNDKCWLFCRGHDPLVYNEGTGNFELISAQVGYTGTVPKAHEAIGAFGRLWACDTDTDVNTVYWSDLLIGQAWNSGTSGSLNLDKVWPDGQDRVVGLAAHNGFLVIFGYRSIVIYSGADSPATMELSDTLTGIGCVDRNSIQYTGSDVIFLSHRGVQSLGRVIQEKSAPMRDVSKNVRDNLIGIWNTETSSVKSVYSPTESFYLLALRDNKTIYCFDTRQPLEDGSFRVTRWPIDTMKCFFRRQDETILIGTTGGIGTYSGYNDMGVEYQVRYYSNPLSFGNSSIVKFVKKINPIIIGGANVTCVVKWAYDFGTNYKSYSFTLALGSEAEYNVGEYGIAEYSGGVLAAAPRINATGSGNLVTVGLEATINAAPISIQEFNIQATMGRMY